MFKNTLFLKIIMIFTLPALGILYFSSLLVFEKINHLDEIYKVKYNLEYMQVTEKLIHSLQKERGLSVTYNESKKLFDKLREQRKISENNFQIYLDFTNNSIQNNYLNINLGYIKEIQKTFYDLKSFRYKIDDFSIDNLDILRKYSMLDEILLNSISSIKSANNLISFNSDFFNIYHLLIYKEYCGLERALISLVLSQNQLTSEIEDELMKSKIVQLNSFKYFYMNSSIGILDIYNKEKVYTIDKNIDEIRKNLKKHIQNKDLSVEKWWELSSSKIDKLDIVMDNILNELTSKSNKIQKDALIEQNISLFFLFVSFSTLISLLFVLKSIIFKEQEINEKNEKQKKVYALLNKANKYLLKNNTKYELYSQVNRIISKNENMVFSFIYDLEESGIKNKIISQDNHFKSLLLDELENLDELRTDNLLTRSINWKSNVIVESFSNKNISIFYKYAKEFNIKSAAAFPIKKFDKIISVLIIYSNEDRFFDYEVEILFDKMIGDLVHSLEKIDYEKNRLNQERELKISSVAFESSEPMLITDEKAQIINVNHAFCQVMGYSRENLIGQNPRMFKSLHQKREFYIALWDSLIKNDSWSGEVYNTKFSGEIIPVRVTITTIRDKDNKVTNYLAQYIDISEQKDKQQVLEYQATHDNLTGLPNRLLLLDRIEHAITKVVRHNIVGGLIFIDLDNFKEINDTLGHDVGDTLLICVAKKLREAVRDEDTISRIGGDEFIILADNIGNDTTIAHKNIEVLAKKVKEALNSIETIDGYENISTPSIGVTLFSDSSVSVKDIIKQADTAMYAAKKQGKNTIEFFN